MFFLLLGLSLCFFPMFGQEKIIEYDHNLNMSKFCVFSVSVVLQTGKRENVHSSPDCDTERTWFIWRESSAALSGEEGEQHSQMQIRVRGYLVQLPAEGFCEVVKRRGFLLKLFSRAFASLASSFLCERLVGLHFS